MTVIAYPQPPQAHHDMRLVGEAVAAELSQQRPRIAAAVIDSHLAGGKHVLWPMAGGRDVMWPDGVSQL